MVADQDIVANVDLIHMRNGSLQGSGKTAKRLLKSGGDISVLRPWEDEETGLSYITVNKAGKDMQILTNAEASLRKDEWIIMDEAVVRGAEPRLKAVADLRGNPGTELTIPNALAKTVFQYQKMSNYGEANVSMDGRNRGKSDAPIFTLDGIPLPIIHADFEYSFREVLASRNDQGTALDSGAASRGGRVVAEKAEQMLIGTAATFAYASYSIYGYTNFPDRNTYTMSDPSAVGWIPDDFIDDVLDMIEILNNDFFYGPFILYHSPNWGKYLNKDYSAAKGDNTLRQRTLAIDSISSIRQLDYLTGFTVLLVQMTDDVVRELVGMDITLVQWEEEGGMNLKFKVMAMLIPQIRSDALSQCGLCHGSV